MANKKIQLTTPKGDNGYPITKTACVEGLDIALSGKASTAQGTKADTAVQAATIGGAAVPKIGTTLQLPSYPTIPAVFYQSASPTNPKDGDIWIKP